MKKTIQWSEKYRHELKYICDNTTLWYIENKLQRVMHYDPHADQHGEYLIRSIYFDDNQYSCFFSNEDGMDPREKYRIRSYNYSSSRISLEKKKKKSNMTGKEICLIDKTTCLKMIHGQVRGFEFLGRSSLLDEWYTSHRTSQLKPLMMSEYLRRPLVFWPGNVRITFDRNICASKQFDRFFNKELSRIAVLPSGYHILEVKYDDFLPDVIYQLIEDTHMIQTTFSKFYLGCKALEGNVYEL